MIYLHFGTISWLHHLKTLDSLLHVASKFAMIVIRHDCNKNVQIRNRDQHQSHRYSWVAILIALHNCFLFELEYWLYGHEIWYGLWGVLDVSQSSKAALSSAFLYFRKCFLAYFYLKKLFCLSVLKCHDNHRDRSHDLYSQPSCYNWKSSRHHSSLH